MAFKITARTLLELGAELIGSDAVAIYELVKNAVDAGSPHVRIGVQSVLLYSRYRQALEAVDSGVRALADIRQDIEGWLTSDAPVGAGRELLRRLDAATNRDRFRKALIRGYEAANSLRSPIRARACPLKISMKSS